MKNFYLKIKNAQESRQYAQILENAGFKWWHKNKGGKYDNGYALYKCGEANEFFFVDYTGSDKPIFNSWAEFLSFLIKQCYCEITNSRDKNKILKLAFDSGLTDSRVDCRDEDICYFDANTYGWPFYDKAPNLYKITFNNMTVLLHALKVAKNNKTMDKKEQKPQTINVEFSIPEAIILYHLANWNVIRDKANECDALGDFLRNHTNTLFLYNRVGDSLKKIGISTFRIGYNNLQTVLDEYNNENSPFEFQNGLKAKYIGEKISIGCRSFDVEALLEKIDSFLEFGVDNIEIEGHTFSSKELKELKDWAQNLK